MRAALSMICAGLSMLLAWAAWALNLLPLPALAMSRWFDAQATRLSRSRNP